jgi:hypothetical protein
VRGDRAGRDRGCGGLRQRLCAVLLGLAALSAGCSAIPLGPVQEPEYYPDRTTHEAAFATFLWAWHTGDVGVLRVVTGGWFRKELEDAIKANGVEAVAAHYRKDDLVVQELEWKDVKDSLAYLRVVLSTRSVARAELDFTLLNRPGDAWVVTGKKLLR